MALNTSCLLLSLSMPPLTTAHHLQHAMVSLNDGLETVTAAASRAAPTGASPDGEPLPWGFSFDGMLMQQAADAGVELQPSLGNVLSLEGLEDILFGENGTAGNASVLASPRDANDEAENAGGQQQHGAMLHGSSAGAAAHHHHHSAPAGLLQGEGFGCASVHESAISSTSLLAR